jgi:RimJ/RimL family protein N-acetyltransferase
MFTRVLIETDAAAFHAVRRRALLGEPEAFGMAPEEMSSLEALTQQFRAQAKGQDAFIMGAFAPELVGTIGCMREPRVKRRHVALIWGVYVLPESRGGGLGRRLLVDTIAKAREWPELEQLRLDVTATNLAARQLYLSCGFHVIGLRRGTLKVEGRHYDEEMMALDLR